jgi:hypothetical protein
MTDDECIAIALLHGCAFWPFDWQGKPIWYARDYSGGCPGGVANHPVEEANFRKTRNRYWFHSRQELARAYCEYHKLLPEVTHEDAPV